MMIATRDQIDALLAEHAGDPLLGRVAELLEPEETVLPSGWAEAERILKEGTTPQPGRWSNDFLPWIRSVLDLPELEPWKKGRIIMKPGQAGISETLITYSGWTYRHMPGPSLFLFVKEEQAKKFSIERYEPMIHGAPSLRGVFDLGRLAHEKMLYKPSSRGALVMAGAGAASNYISNPYRHVYIDEFDEIGEVPGHGDPFQLLLNRQAEWSTSQRCTFNAWAHPTLPDIGIARAYRELSDQREWTIDCPHCGEAFVPQWEHVQIGETGGVRDPETAVYVTPCCASELGDIDRWRATRNGRFVSQLDDATARRRQFIGLHFSKLCHPRIALQQLAESFCDCTNEQQLRVFYNKEMGLPYHASSIVITERDIERLVDGTLSGRERRCPADTLWITMGVDVQAPAHDPTLYYVITAWTATGAALLIEFGRLARQAWTMLHQLIVGFYAQRGDEQVRLAGVGIDYGFLTRQVYDFCRQTHGGISCIPFKHTPGVKPHVQWRKKTVLDPNRPELGGLTRFETCRTYWMDRALGRFAPERDDSLGGGIILPATVNREFIQHILANKRFEDLDEHGHPVANYEKETTRRDDWLQSLVYSEMVAVLLGIDRLHESVQVERRTSEAQRSVLEVYEREEQMRQQQRRRPFAPGRRSGRQVW